MAPKHTERARFRCNPLTTHSVPGPVGSPNGSLYGVLLNHLQTFLARADERAGPGLPAFVRRELYRNLDCGILANGFARVHCAQGGPDELVPFSCKGRGFCPSCCGRRMADTAFHLADQVLSSALLHGEGRKVKRDFCDHRAV